jgi:cysteine desulfurase family protein (TIGR01976 family)
MSEGSVRTVQCPSVVDGRLRSCSSADAPLAELHPVERRRVIKFDSDKLRAEFPALALENGGRPVAYFDGPGGTQVPQRVIDAVVRYYMTSNANDGGAFITSQASDASTLEAHAALADFLGAASPDEIKFGANMTSITFHLSRSIGAMMQAGDEILVTTLDHEANVSPWLGIADERGLVVRTVDIRPDDATLDLDSLEAALGRRTRLVAVGYASNAVGTINPVKEIVARAHEVGALTYVDAVHYAPHGPINVVDLDTDFLVTSVYKWFGPHLGAVYGRASVLDRLPAFKVRPAHDRFETGTQNFEGIAGALAAVDYLRSVGRRFGDVAASAGASERRRELVAAMTAIQAYERMLAGRLIRGLAAIPGIRMWGISDQTRIDERTPTFAVTIDGTSPRAAAEALGREGLFGWDGDFYARALIERLGLLGGGGVLRLGLVHYNTAAEVDWLLEALESIAARGRAGLVPV